MKRTVFSILLLTAGLAGCVGSEDAVDPASEASAAANFPTCEHPWPCADGSEWPANLTGPFELDEVVSYKVPSFDGIELAGHVWLPDVPDRTPVPVVLWSSPYFGQPGFPYIGDSGQPTDSPDLWDSKNVPVGKLVENGFAVAAFNVRGTGDSGGCFEDKGTNSQRDQAVLVEWLGDQDWSNGRVAMMGLSHPGTTPWMAAIQDPQALKSIVVAGMVSDEYLFYHSPQGAVGTLSSRYQAEFQFEKTGPGGSLERWAGVPPERVCAEVLAAMTSVATGTATEDRHPDYWRDRRYIDGFPNVTTSVLLTHGFQDRGHAQQELAVWETVPDTTPKHQLQGQWGHEFPNRNSFNESWALENWNDRLLDWLGFWLKGLGDPPEALGTVEYQDGTGAWHNATAWPPADGRDEVLFLAGNAIAPSAMDGTRAFRSMPDHAGSLDAALANQGWPGPLCTYDRTETPLTLPHGLLYASDPLEERALVAGNPFAYLTVTSDLPGGLVTVTLLDLGPDFRCEDDKASDARAITTGTADLRFHRGSYVATDFPTDRATQVRIDLFNLAEVIEPGHQLAALIYYGYPWHRTSHPYTPIIDVHGESHLVLPLVEGSLGGEAPSLDYPPRPFVPGEVSQ